MPDLKSIGVRVTEQKGEVTFALNNKKKVQVKTFKGTCLVDFREYWEKDQGQSLPTKKGLCITKELFEKFKAVIPHIDLAIKKIENES